MEKNINIVDIKENNLTELILEPGKDLYIKNITSKTLIIHIEPRYWLDEFDSFAKSLK